MDVLENIQKRLWTNKILLVDYYVKFLLIIYGFSSSWIYSSCPYFSYTDQTQLRKVLAHYCPEGKIKK